MTQNQSLDSVSLVILCQAFWSLPFEYCFSWSLLVFSLGFPHSVAEAVCTLRDHYLLE